MPHFPSAKTRRQIFKKIFGDHPEVEKAVGEAFATLADKAKGQPPCRAAEEEARRAERSSEPRGR